MAGGDGPQQTAAGSVPGMQLAALIFFLLFFFAADSAVLAKRHIDFSTQH